MVFRERQPFPGVDPRADVDAEIVCELLREKLVPPDWCHLTRLRGTRFPGESRVAFGPVVSKELLVVADLRLRVFLRFRDVDGHELGLWVVDCLGILP